MKKRGNYRPGQGSYFYITITDQFNSRDVIFKDGAPADNREKVFELLRRAKEKGLEVDLHPRSDAERNREFLFGP